MAQSIKLTTPVGRVVMGSLYKPRTTNAEGGALVYASGPNKGQPKVDYFFMLAIPKGAEKHWGETAWGAEILKFGRSAFGSVAESPSFAWKIKDGDSTIPNKKGNKPCDNEGWAGNWVLTLAGGYAPEIYKQENGGLVREQQADFIKPGHFVQVVISPNSNGSENQPGIFLYHSMVCFRAYGTEIHFGMNVEEAGFGAAPLPAGASAMPPAVSLPLVPSVGALPSGGQVSLPPVPTVPLPNVQPNPGFLNVPVVPAVPSVVPPPPPAPVASGPQMTAAANGISYAAYIAGGWTDASLRANGLMV